EASGQAYSPAGGKHSAVGKCRRYYLRTPAAGCVQGIKDPLSRKWTLSGITRKCRVLGRFCAAVGFPARAVRPPRAGGLAACRARGLPQRMAFAVFTLAGAAISMLASSARLFASPSA